MFRFFRQKPSRKSPDFDWSLYNIERSSNNIKASQIDSLADTIKTIMLSTNKPIKKRKKNGNEDRTNATTFAWLMPEHVELKSRLIIRTFWIFPGGQGRLRRSRWSFFPGATRTTSTEDPVSKMDYYLCVFRSHGRRTDYSASFNCNLYQPTSAQWSIVAFHDQLGQLHALRNRKQSPPLCSAFLQLVSCRSPFPYKIIQ